ncbi:hypothetical protein GCM10010508_51880 [Streptomyces naganishii JCM 4654]|uniref:Uncharacterized protein n=1 Tax=Streptomyces naganishii JCM 4654 TaxID=1306179 RepID=A0A919CXB5_9ACTN|nr:hypothetical protein GCM10010508_51880 [Streptomyces naganishii JCM 4654]
MQGEQGEQLAGLGGGGYHRDPALVRCERPQDLDLHMHLPLGRGRPGAPVAAPTESGYRDSHPGAGPAQ